MILKFFWTFIEPTSTVSCATKLTEKCS